MCWQMAAAAGGAGLSAYDNLRAAREQSRALAGMAANDTAAQQEGGRIVSDEAARLGRSTGETERNALNAGFMNALRGATAQRTAPAVGAMSGRFMTDLKASQAAGDAEARARAGDAATVQGAHLQRQNEARDFNRTALDLGLLADRMRGQDAIWRLKASLAQPNAGAQAAGQFLSGYGQSLARRGSAQAPEDIDGK